MNLIDVIFYSLIAGAATLLGTWLVFRREEWAEKNSIFLISFAAGVMLTLSFSHLIPESLELFPHAPIAVFTGFLLFYILQQVIMFHACHEEACDSHHLSILSSIGLTVHSLLDGIAITAGFVAGWSLGVMTTIAVLLHEAPEGITITSILMHARAPRKKIITYSVIVALATPVGAIASFFFLKNVSPQSLGILLALTAGSFIYLAASDLIPETHRKHHHANAIYFFAGVVLTALVGRLLH